MLWCSVQKVRERKSRMIMEALATGWGESARLIDGDPPDDGEPFAIYGQTWGAERLLPGAIKQGRAYWYVDNGYWKPGRGAPNGYYRICYRGMSPVLLPSPSETRARKIAGDIMRPWRSTGRHVVLAVPGADYGVALGLNMANWLDRTRAILPQVTDRPILMRHRETRRPLAEDLEGAWALVTFASNAAVEAVIAGVPVFVDPMSAAAPVGNCDLAHIESPRTPECEQWWRSLMCQQFTPAEMGTGLAYVFLRQVREIVDRQSAAA